MAHLQYMPGDPRLVDQLVYELKSKGIFDQFRKDCIADVDTRPAYQNLRQRVENSVSTFLSRQCWKPDLNKNQLREKLRKHIMDGNYLEQGVERIVDQVVNPKVATVFIPQVEDLVYNYLGITRKKAPAAETSENLENLLPTDLEAVSPGSVKSNEDKNESMDTSDTVENMVIDQEDQTKSEEKVLEENKETEDFQMSGVTEMLQDSNSMDKSSIPLPAEEIRLENIPAPENSPPKIGHVELDSIALPQEQDPSTDIPLPDEIVKIERSHYFQPLSLNSDDSNSSSDSSLRRNMSPLTPIRNFNNENSCDAQQGFDDDSDAKSNDKTAPNSFHFAIENKDVKQTENTNDIKADKKESELSYQFNNQVNINTYNTPMYDDSSNSNHLQIDYESDVNSKTNTEIKPEVENSQDAKKDKKSEDRKSSHKSSHRSRDSSRHSTSKDHKRSESKHSASRDSSKHEKKSSSSKDDKYKSSKERDRSKDRKDSRDSSRNRSSHKSSSSKDKDSKSHRSSSSSHRHSSKSADDKKSSSSKDKEKAPESSRDRNSKDKSRDSRSSSHRSDKDKKGSSNSSSKKSEDKDKKKDKKDVDDHYSSSGRGNHGRRSTDRDSNDGSSSSKGCHNQNGSKTSENKKDGKSTSSKSDNTSICGDSTSPSDKEQIVLNNSKMSQFKPIVRVDNHLETPIATPPRLPFVPDVTLKKPRFAANLQEAKKLMKMRKFLDDEQKRMNQEAALLLEFQANVRPSLSQVYSSIPGPELEFACVANVTPEPPFETNVQSIITEEELKPAIIKDDTEIATSTESAKVENEDIKTKDHLNTPTEIIENDQALESVKEEKVETDDSVENQAVKTESTFVPELDSKSETSYDENKPFSELMDEITEYSKASESKNKVDDNTETKSDVEESILISDPDSSGSIEMPLKYFEVTIITEEVSESETIEAETVENTEHIEENIERTAENKEPTEENEKQLPQEPVPNLLDKEFHYFAEHEKYDAELKRHEYDSFLKTYTEAVSTNKKIYVINCDSYEESIVREMSSTFGTIDVINYYKNGYLKLPNTTKNVVKDVKLSTEITLPIEPEFREKSPLFSPVKSDCSFELCSEYDTKIDDITKKSRQEVMEIILGTAVDASPSKMPKIDYYTECPIEDSPEEDNKLKESVEEVERTEKEGNKLKRSFEEVESSVNNNRSVLTPHKMRRLSESDQISSTTEETEESSNNNKVTNTRSKYLGRARRVGLPRPRRPNQSNSPSSDKSVENYSQNSPTPNGKIKPTPRSKVQRYDTSDLYKPKLHYLSRRNNIT